MKKIIGFIKNLLQIESPSKNLMGHGYERCYSNMEYSGIAAFGCCDGETKSTEYLSEICANCQHFCDVGKEVKIND